MVSAIVTLFSFESSFSKGKTVYLNAAIYCGIFFDQSIFYLFSVLEKVFHIFRWLNLSTILI